MDFGKAVNICKSGRSIRRRGWNGKDQFVFYVPEAKMFPNTKLMRVYSDNGLIAFRDFLAMKTVDGTIVPWVASQSDLLADDWECYFKKAEKPKQNPLKNFLYIFCKSFFCPFQMRSKSYQYFSFIFIFFFQNI